MWACRIERFLSVRAAEKRDDPDNDGTVIDITGTISWKKINLMELES